MSGKGWISLHRKMLDNPVVCKDSDHVAVWVYLLLNATHAEYPALFAGDRITLQPGQLITGRKVIAEKFKISESKVQRILKSFESEQQIEQQNGNKNRLISILSWEDYQDDEHQNEQQLNNKRTTTEQQNDGENRKIEHQNEHQNDAENAWCYDTFDGDEGGNEQQSEQQLNNKKTADIQKVNTNNNNNNINDNENKKDKSPKNPKRIYSEDELYYRLAKRFHELALKNAEEAGTAHLIKEPNYQSWSDTFRLMFEKDKVKETEIGKVVKYALSDSFYRTIIFSPTNLRKHYLAILTKMNTGGGGHGGDKRGNAGYAPANRANERGKTRVRESKPVSREIVQEINSFE